MVYHFKLFSQESEKFRLEISLDEKHTFFDFHNIIQKSLAYESHQLSSFFVMDSRNNKKKEISLLDLGINGPAYLIMQKTKISDIVKSEGQRLIYTFDFFNDRSYIIELTGINMERSLNEPLITFKVGDTPLQVLGDEPLEVDTITLQEEEVFMDFGELDDYTELYGEMDDF